VRAQQLYGTGRIHGARAGASTLRWTRPCPVRSMSQAAELSL